MEKPSRTVRELVVNQELFTEMLENFPDAEFRDYLLFLWNTGCRAMDVRVIVYLLPNASVPPTPETL